MAKDSYINNSLVEFLEEKQNSQNGENQSNFQIYKSMIELKTLEENLQIFLKKSKKKRREIRRDYNGFFEEMGEEVFWDSMQLLNTLNLEGHDMREVDAYIKKLQNVHLLLRQIEEG